MRRGLAVSWRPEDRDEAWFVSALLKDPEALYNRFGQPALRNIGRAPYTEDDVRACRLKHPVSGKMDRYIDAMKRYEDMGIDIWEAWTAIERAAAALQEDPGGAALSALLEPLQRRDMEPTPELLTLADDILRRVPRWYNLGWSAEELTRLIAPARSPEAGRETPERGAKPSKSLPGGRRPQ